MRLITEPEVVSTVLKHHTYEAAEKFIQEVCWRTYWKGWLEARSGVWKSYGDELTRARDRWDTNIQYRSAIEGRTGIDCFDAFAQELLASGYLHNHARMWFASIWIFTLRLPWVLGADFFFRHLLDGDPASNTLSWRWVAGLQTRGKHYVATADNIRRYTAGRFRVDTPLAENPEPLLEAGGIPNPIPLPSRRDPLPQGTTGLLISEDDLGAAEWLAVSSQIEAVAFAMPFAAYASHGIAPHVIEFRRRAMVSAATTHGEKSDANITIIDAAEDTASGILSWAREHRLRSVIMAEPAVGLWDELKNEVAQQLRNTGISLIFRRHPWDEAFYPHATKGFFHLKTAIPGLIKRDLTSLQTNA